MANIEIIRKMLSDYLDDSIASRDKYKAGVDGLGFQANFALEQHYEGKVEAYERALALLDLLEDESTK